MVADMLEAARDLCALAVENGRILDLNAMLVIQKRGFGL